MARDLNNVTKFPFKGQASLKVQRAFMLTFDTSRHLRSLLIRAMQDKAIESRIPILDKCMSAAAGGFFVLLGILLPHWSGLYNISEMHNIIYSSICSILGVLWIFLLCIEKYLLDICKKSKDCLLIEAVNIIDDAENN